MARRGLSPPASADTRGPGAAWRTGVVVAVVGVLLAGCRSAAPPTPLGPDQLEQAVAQLARPLPDGLAALYRLRVPRSSGLRLSVNVRGEEGRMSVTEPFSGLLSLTAWSAEGSPRVWDMRKECRVGRADLADVFGLSAMPLAEAVRLLGGRLPASPSDSVSATPDGLLAVAGEGWSCAVQVAPAPWRVVGVEDTGDGGAWRVELADHGGSIPHTVRVERRNGPWARLELIRLEWHADQQLAPLPDLPPCGSARKRS